MALIGTGGEQQWPPPAPERKPAVKSYEVDVNGVRTVLQLSDEDAKARGLKASDEAKPAAKARADVPNKARTAAEKRAEVAEKSFQKPAKKTP